MGFQSQNCHLEATRHTAQRQEHGIIGKIGGYGSLPVLHCSNLLSPRVTTKDLRLEINKPIILCYRCPTAHRTHRKLILSSTDIALEHSLRRHTVSGITWFRETSTNTTKHLFSSAPVAVFYAMYHFCVIFKCFLHLLI